MGQGVTRGGKKESLGSYLLSAAAGIAGRWLGLRMRNAQLKVGLLGSSSGRV